MNQTADRAAAGASSNRAADRATAGATSNRAGANDAYGYHNRSSDNAFGDRILHYSPSELTAHGGDYGGGGVYGGRSFVGPKKQTQACVDAGGTCLEEKEDNWDELDSWETTPTPEELQAQHDSTAEAKSTKKKTRFCNTTAAGC